MNLRQESFQGSSARFVAFIYARTFEHLGKHLSDLITDDALGVVRVEFRMSTHKLVSPIRVLGKLIVFAQIFAVQKRRPQVSHLFFQPSRQNCKTHDFDQADVLFFDVVQLFMWMVKPHGVLFCRQVIAQHKVKLISAVSHTCDRRNGVVRLAVRFRKDHRVRVGICTPLGKDSARQLAELRLVRAVQAQNRHRVLPEQHIGFWKNLSARFDVAEHKIAAGGAERFHSVRNGLAALTSDPGLIAVQDGVRPLGSVAMIRRVAEAAAKHGAAIPVVEPVDSFRETDGEADAAGRAASHIVDRRLLRIVQTPQIFRAEVLRRAYESEYRAEFTDDASVVEAVGQAVCLAEGERENLKLTTPGDFVIAEALIAAREEAENEEGTTDAEHV